MKKRSVLGIAIAVVVYLLLFVLASSCGLIHPACYAYAGTFVPLLFSLVYLYITANMQCFGAAAILNGFVLGIGLILGAGCHTCYENCREGDEKTGGASEINHP